MGTIHQKENILNLLEELFNKIKVTYKTEKDIYDKQHLKFIKDFKDGKRSIDDFNYKHIKSLSYDEVKSLGLERYNTSIYEDNLQGVYEVCTNFNNKIKDIKHEYIYEVVVDDNTDIDNIEIEDDELVDYNIDLVGNIYLNYYKLKSKDSIESYLDTITSGVFNKIYRPYRDLIMKASAGKLDLVFNISQSVIKDILEQKSTPEDILYSLTIK